MAIRTMNPPKTLTLTEADFKKIANPQETNGPKEIGQNAFTAKANKLEANKPATNPFATDAKSDSLKTELDKVNKEIEAIKKQNAAPVQPSKMQFEG